MHGQMQERIALRALYRIVGRQRLLGIAKRFIIFGMLNHPVARNGFDGSQNFIGAVLAKSLAKKAPYIVLGWGEHRIGLDFHDLAQSCEPRGQASLYACASALECLRLWTACAMAERWLSPSRFWCLAFVVWFVCAVLLVGLVVCFVC